MKRLILLSLLVLGACVQYVVVEPKRTTVQNVMAVEPQIAWNRANGSPTAAQGDQGLAAETWTVDGPLLHTLTFFTGVGDGQALGRQRPGSEDKLPVFKSNMTPNDVMELIEATITRQSISSLVKARDLRAAKFGSQGGFRFELTYVLKDEVERDGMVVGCIKDGKLFMVMYSGTKLYHYGKYMPQVERIVESIQLL